MLFDRYTNAVYDSGYVRVYSVFPCSKLFVLQIYS
jgi:hypothetical protein